MNVDYAEFQKTFDSRTISKELPQRATTYSALSFDQVKFFNMANLFSLSRKPFVVCYCFREPIKTFFLDTC